MVSVIEKSNAAITTRSPLETKSFRTCISVKLNRAFAVIIRYTYRNRACVRACVRACIHVCTHAVPQRTFAAQRNGVSFLLRKSCPNGERMAHGWNRLTCKLRARMLDASGSSLIVMRVNAQSIRRHRCASDPFAFVAFANIVSNPYSKN